MKQIGEYAYKSTLYNITPGQKILLGVIPLLLSMIFNTMFVSLIVIIAMFLFSIAYGKVTIKRYIKLLLIPVSFLIIGAITIVIGEIGGGQQALLSIAINDKQYGVSVTSAVTGMLLILRAMACVSCMYFICLTTPMQDILGTLRKIKVPTVVISLMELIYRYIFVLLDEADKMRIAQHSRLGYVDLKTSIKSVGQLIGTLFLRAFSKCDRIYSALQSRGYEGEIKTVSKKYEYSAKLVAICIGFSLLLIIVGVIEWKMQ